MRRARPATSQAPRPHRAAGWSARTPRGKSDGRESPAPVARKARTAEGRRPRAAAARQPQRRRRDPGARGDREAPPSDSAGWPRSNSWPDFQRDRTRDVAVDVDGQLMRARIEQPAEGEYDVRGIRQARRRNAVSDAVEAQPHVDAVEARAVDRQRVHVLVARGRYRVDARYDLQPPGVRRR